MSWRNITINDIAPDGTKWGEFPSDMREMSEEEVKDALFEIFFMYAPAAVEYRQVNIDQTCKTFRIFWKNDGTGYAVERAVERARGLCGKWYHIGCDHEYKELSQQEAREKGMVHHGLCWHVLKCNKCGNIKSYDSS